MGKLIQGNFPQKSVNVGRPSLDKKHSPKWSKWFLPSLGCLAVTAFASYNFETNTEPSSSLTPLTECPEPDRGTASLLAPHLHNLLRPHTDAIRNELTSDENSFVMAKVVVEISSDGLPIVRDSGIFCKGLCSHSALDWEVVTEITGPIQFKNMAIGTPSEQCYINVKIPLRSSKYDSLLDP